MRLRRASCEVHDSRVVAGVAHDRQRARDRGPGDGRFERDCDLASSTCDNRISAGAEGSCIRGTPSKVQCADVKIGRASVRHRQCSGGGAAQRVAAQVESSRQRTDGRHGYSCAAYVSYDSAATADDRNRSILHTSA